VRLKRCTQFIVAAFLILVSTALILDSPGLLAASLSLGALIVCRYQIFFSRLQSLAASVRIERAITKKPIRQGTSGTITTRIIMTVEEGVKGTYKESIPAGIHVEDGETRSPDFSAGIHEHVLIYRITPLTHGNITFPGGLFVVQDQFFESELSLSKSGFTGPVLHVKPSPFFEKSRQGSQADDREVHMVRVQHGSTIRSFRDYTQDDDVRNIDWKLSAKNDTLIVREYTGIENYPPLIIIDLPDLDQEYDMVQFSEVVRVISGIIEKTLQGGSSISLLIISGPNIISTLLEEYDVSQYMAIIRERFHPHIRPRVMYRTVPRSEIREYMRKIQDSFTADKEEIVLNHLSRLNKIYHHHLISREINQFSIQISRMFSSVRMNEISLFSLCDGDISYILEIARQARYSRIRFRIRTSADRDKLLLKFQYKELRREVIEGVV
jgi:hypothetical protein